MPVTTSHEHTIVVRYQPDAADGWPWSVTHEGETIVLTITDLDDSSIGIVLRALAQASASESDPSDRFEPELAAT